MPRKPSLGTTDKPTVTITRQAKDMIIRWLNEPMRPEQGQAVSAILQWFVEQPEVMQQVILRTYPGRMKAVYAAELRRIADDVENANDLIELPAVAPRDEEAWKQVAAREKSGLRAGKAAYSGKAK